MIQRGAQWHFGNAICLMFHTTCLLEFGPLKKYTAIGIDSAPPNVLQQRERERESYHALRITSAISFACIQWQLKILWRSNFMRRLCHGSSAISWIRDAACSTPWTWQLSAELWYDQWWFSPKRSLTFPHPILIAFIIVSLYRGICKVNFSCHGSPSLRFGTSCYQQAIDKVEEVQSRVGWRVWYMRKASRSHWTCGVWQGMTESEQKP